MLHLGDITKMSGYDIPPVDVITGGSPCQDLSVAGKRAGLDGERSGLFMEQMRIVREMRDKEIQNGRAGQFIRPRFMVWENVPGAFSSGNPKGADFQAVLEEIVKIVCREAPSVPIPTNGWPKCGCISGVGDSGTAFSVCWRVHDAQFWGVPQRRKRIALVADFGGLAAPEVLLERNCMPWDTEQSGETREGSAGTLEEGSGESSFTLKIRGGREIDSLGNKAGKGALVQEELSATLGVSQDQTLFSFEPGITSRCGGHIYEDSTGALRAHAGDNQPAVYEEKVISFDPSFSSHYGGTTFEDVAKTLTPGTAPGHHDGVAFSVDQGAGKSSVSVHCECRTTLATTHDGAPAVVAADLYNQTVTGDVSKTLNAIKSDSDHTPVIVHYEDLDREEIF